MKIVYYIGNIQSSRLKDCSFHLDLILLSNTKQFVYSNSVIWVYIICQHVPICDLCFVCTNHLVFQTGHREYYQYRGLDQCCQSYLPLQQWCQSCLACYGVLPARRDAYVAGISGRACARGLRCRSCCQCCSRDSGALPVAGVGLSCLLTNTNTAITVTLPYK